MSCYVISMKVLIISAEIENCPSPIVTSSIYDTVLSYFLLNSLLNAQKMNEFVEIGNVLKKSVVFFMAFSSPHTQKCYN